MPSATFEVHRLGFMVVLVNVFHTNFHLALSGICRIGYSTPLMAACEALRYFAKPGSVLSTRVWRRDASIGPEKLAR